MSKRVREQEEQKKRQATRVKLRMLIRSVMFNRIWLQDTEDQKLSLNVKKNIAMLIRTQRKVGLLTIAEKSLIRSNHWQRSVEDRKKLVHLMSNLVCFSKLPPKVRARLVPIVKFMVLGPGRIIIKEGNEAVTAYFILTGEVEYSKKVYDQLKRKYIDKVISVSGPGECIGDVELLENIPRLYTCATTSEVELLVIYIEEFNIVLRPELEKQWRDKKAAIESLNYFDFFSQDQIISACRFGTIHQFEPLETIYFEDKGHLSFSYFVLSGECMILQCLKLKAMRKNGKKTYELTAIEDSDVAYRDSIFTDEKKSVVSPLSLDKEIEAAVEAEDAEKINGMRKRFMMTTMDIKSIETACGLHEPSIEEVIESLNYEEIGEEHEEEENLSIEEDDDHAAVQIHESYSSLDVDLDSKHDIAASVKKRESSDDDDAADDKTGNRASRKRVRKSSRYSKLIHDSVQYKKNIRKSSILVDDKKIELKKRRDAELEQERAAVRERQKAKLEQVRRKSKSGYIEPIISKTSTIMQVVSKSSITRTNFVPDMDMAPSTSKSSIKKGQTTAVERKADSRRPPKTLEERIDEEEDYEEGEEEDLYLSDAEEQDIEISSGEHTDESQDGLSKKTSRKKRQKKDGPKIESHFIDVGSLTFGGVFGLGEPLEHRVIMARTTVQCFVLPRFWLLEREQNPGNVWQRRRMFLETHIPSRAQLYEHLLATKRWQTFKKNLIKDIVRPETIPNATHVEDIPIVIRLVEESDEDDDDNDE